MSGIYQLVLQERTGTYRGKKMRIAAYQFAVTGDMVENFEKIKKCNFAGKEECCPAPCFSGMRVDRLPAERYQKLV